MRLLLLMLRNWRFYATFLYSCHRKNTQLFLSYEL